MNSIIEKLVKQVFKETLTNDIFSIYYRTKKLCQNAEIPFSQAWREVYKIISEATKEVLEGFQGLQDVDDRHAYRHLRRDGVSQQPIAHYLLFPFFFISAPYLLSWRRFFIISDFTFLIDVVE